MFKKSIYHILAIAVVIVWGTTFVSTKMLLLNGLTPAAIFALRFVIAYIILAAAMTCRNRGLGEDNDFSLGELGESVEKLSSTSSTVSPRENKNNSTRGKLSLKDELLFLALGLTGGSLYFLTENMALEHTTATNTSLIVCSCPLFATIMVCGFFQQHLTKRQILGAIIAFLGMAVVVLNGQFVLHLSPLGDLLAFGACICWALYSVIIRLLADNYPSAVINRKIFFYGILTIMPWFLVFPEEIPTFGQLTQPIVLGNILFLALVASLACYCLWTVCIKRLGVIEATNYVYLNPLATMVAAALVLSEHITIWFLAGSVLILLGLYLHNKAS